MVERSRHLQPAPLHFRPDLLLRTPHLQVLRSHLLRLPHIQFYAYSCFSCETFLDILPLPLPPLPLPPPLLLLPPPLPPPVHTLLPLLRRLERHPAFRRLRRE